MRQVSEGNLCWVSLSLSLSMSLSLLHAAVFLTRKEKGGKSRAAIQETITYQNCRQLRQVVLALNANAPDVRNVVF